jgi:hypothetical protein
MMPRRKKTLQTEDAPAGVTLAGRAEDTLDEFADDLGRLLDAARTKADRWIGQRQSIAAQLAAIRDAADRWISELTREKRGPGRPGRPAASASGPSSLPGDGTRRGRKKRTMSAEARAKIGAAQRARWAKQKRQSQA